MTGKRKVLDSWKEIAAYLGRAEKTCREWELRLGLPIHRLSDSVKARVFAYPEELDEWKEQRGQLAPSPENGLADTPGTKAGRAPKKTLRLLFGVILVATLAAVFWRLSAMWGLGESSFPPDSVAVAGFENQTGDERWDHLREAVPDLIIVGLEQMRFGYVATWERLRDLCRQAGKGEVGFIDAETCLEMCRRSNIRYVIVGSIVRADEVFATEVKVIEAKSGRLVKGVAASGEGADSILRTQVDDLCAGISASLASASAQAVRPEADVADITTGSMDAYRCYCEGVGSYEKGRLEEARAWFEKAIALDPEYAAAHHELGAVHLQLLNRKEHLASWAKSRELAHRSPERERLLHEAEYAVQIEGDKERAIEILKELTDKYPMEKRAYWLLANYYYFADLYRESIAVYRKALEIDPYFEVVLDELGEPYLALGEYNKARRIYEKYLALYPGEAGPLAALARVSFKQARFEPAAAKFREALELDPDHYYSLNGLHQVYALSENFEEAMTWVDRYIERSASLGVKVDGHVWKALYHYWLGQFAQAGICLDRADSLAEVGRSAGKRNSLWCRGTFALERGEYETARGVFEDWREFMAAFFPRAQAVTLAALNYALGLIDLGEGRLASARERLAEMETLLPQTAFNSKAGLLKYQSQCLAGEILLAEGSLDGAISLLEKIERPDDKVLFTTDYRILYHLTGHEEILARAYQDKGETDKAIAIYEQLTNLSPARKSRQLIRPQAYFRLANLYEQKGRGVLARGQFRKFLDRWKDVDPGLPEVETARRKTAED